MSDAPPTAVEFRLQQEAWLAEERATVATLRSHLETATAENERLEALFQQSHGCHSSWVAKGVKLATALETARKALEAVQRAITPAIGDGMTAGLRLAGVSSIVDDALRALDTPAATPAACERCGGSGTVACGSMGGIFGVNDKTCPACDLDEDEHHSFTPFPKRPGCVCETESWGDPANVPPVCSAFVPMSADEPTYCKNCEHDVGCHSRATPHAHSDQWRSEVSCNHGLSGWDCIVCGPSDAAIRARGKAMSRLGLPHPWSPRTRWRMFWNELDRQLHPRRTPGRGTR